MTSSIDNVIILSVSLRFSPRLCALCKVRVRFDHNVTDDFKTLSSLTVEDRTGNKIINLNRLDASRSFIRFARVWTTCVVLGGGSTSGDVGLLCRGLMSRLCRQESREPRLG